MYMSGARIGRLVTAVVHRPILRDQVVALIASCVVVAGTTARGAVASRVATTAVLATVATSAASASLAQLSRIIQTTNKRDIWCEPLII